MIDIIERLADPDYQGYAQSHRGWEALELLHEDAAAEITSLRARVKVLEAIIDAAGSKIDVILDDLLAQIARDCAVLREKGAVE